jgi:hypothetical protein
MVKRPPRRGTVLTVETLEARETPTTSPTPGVVLLQDNFATTHLGKFPSGWAQWGTGRGFAVSADHAQSGTHSLSVSGSQDQTARAWVTTPLPADVQASADIYLGSLIPGEVFVRGTGLDTAGPSYYALSLRRGVYAQLLRVDHGQTTVLATLSSQDYLTGKWVTATLSVVGNKLRAQIFRTDTRQYLNGSGEWQDTPAWVLERSDYALRGPGQAGVAREAGFSGTLSFDDFAVAYAASGSSQQAAGGEGGGLIPQHYPWIRVAELAYSTLPIGSFEDQLLRNSVDLVVSGMDSLGDHIHNVAPHTPQLAYENTSSLYFDLLTDWLSYADAHGVSREGAFYHVAQAIPFQGNSGSSQPVNWFWGVYLGGGTPDFIDLTAAAHTNGARSVPFGGDGQALYVGYPDKFRELNLNLAQGAHDGWSAVLEYPTAVDAFGNPTAWAPLRTLSDTTRGLARSGQILFDPPTNWKPAVAGGTARLYYVRFRTVNDGTAPLANTILGRDYVGAHGRTEGVIPAFDYAADRDHDGYLSDAEWAHRRPGFNARFVYESRVFYGYYGQERFATNPSFAPFRSWAVDFSLRYLNGHPDASGLFMDNSSGSPFLLTASVREPVATYATDYGAMLKAIGQAIAPRWILANTGGGGTGADGVVRQNTAYFEEFALRPLVQTWQQFEDLAATIAHRAGLRSPSPYAVLDSLPTGGSPTDPRTQLATLAEYYLLADPKRTFIDFFGGFEPGTNWNRHWVPAAAYDVGQPQGTWSLYATGADPANRSLTYRVYGRRYDNALVLYRPVSYALGARSPGALGNASATRLALGGTYRILEANGKLGPSVTSVSLRNGEGAILIKA